MYQCYWSRNYPLIWPYLHLQRHFAAVFGSDATVGARRTRDSQRKWMLVGVVLLTGVLLGALLAKKHA